VYNKWRLRLVLWILTVACMSCVERERERERERVCIHTSLLHAVGCFDLNNDMDLLYKLWACKPSNITLDQGVDWSPDSCVKMAYNGIVMHMEIRWFNSLSANSKGVHYLEIIQWSLDKQLMQQESVGCQLPHYRVIKMYHLVFILQNHL
jgi:hypothetical protein